MALCRRPPVLAPTPGSYDAGGLRKPVAHKMADGSWRLFYAAIGADGVSRIAYATSTDGITWASRASSWTESTPPTTSPRAASSRRGGAGRPGETLFFTGTDRFGWTRVGKAQAAGAGFLDGGTAEYELANPTARDWRRILWTPATQPAGTDAQVWVSYYPTFSGDWSEPFPMTNDTDLPFLLNVQKHALAGPHDERRRGGEPFARRTHRQPRSGAVPGQRQGRHASRSGRPRGSTCSPGAT